MIKDYDRSGSIKQSDLVKFVTLFRNLMKVTKVIYVTKIHK